VAEAPVHGVRAEEALEQLAAAGSRQRCGKRWSVPRWHRDFEGAGLREKVADKKRQGKIRWG